MVIAQLALVLSDDFSSVYSAYHVPVKLIADVAYVTHRNNFSYNLQCTIVPYVMCVERIEQR